MAESKRVKLSEQASDRLYEMIVEEQVYAPGSKLPNENELSEELRVSRTTLREAISFLVAQGVLEIRRGCGTFVSAIPGLSDDPLGLRFITNEDLNLHLFEARQVLEPYICRMAALRAEDDELELLSKLADDIDELDLQLQGKGTSPEVIQSITAKDIAFHTFLCRMSKNPVFDRMLPIVIKSVRVSYSLLIPRIENAPRVSIHKQIYNAVANHDGDEAYRLMVQHLRNSRVGFEEKLARENSQRKSKKSAVL